jgi:hypothetical protein
MTCPRPTPFRTPHAALALLAGLLAGATPHAQAGPGPLDNKCNENPPAFGPSGELPFVDHLGLADDAITPMLTGTPLDPGRPCRRTHDPQAVARAVEGLVLQLKRPFNFIDGAGVVAGTLNERSTTAPTTGARTSSRCR